jgi:hypothetical protein
MATGRIGTTPVLQVRWSKAPSAGTTSLSGLDDNSVSLVYSVGYEAVYRNGVLLSRTNDYTATNGTTVTLIDATIAGDIIEIFANQTIPLSDTYSQTVANGKFINNTLTTTTGDIIYASAANTPARLGIGSTDQVLKVSGGIPAWGAAPSPTAVGVSVWKTGTMSLTSGAYTLFTFDGEYFDTDGFHSTTTNTGRLTVPTGLGGKYLISVNFRTASSSFTDIVCRISKNGNAIAHYEGQTPGNSAVQSFAWAVPWDLAAGDYVEFYVYHAFGSTLNGEIDQDRRHFSIMRLGA